VTTISTSDAATRVVRTWAVLRRALGSDLQRRVVAPVDELDHVDPANLDLLDLLATDEGRRMSDLATTLGVDPSTVTRAMHRLEAAGLAARGTVAGDGRAVSAHLTPEGRRVQGLVTARRAALVDDAMAALGPDDRERLAELLERFVGALLADGGERPPVAG
jgi:DNA-binding MarR family transcriptional regulator